MNDANAIALALLLLRAALGTVMIAHGWNHVFGGGKLAGTAGWFGSMGMRMPVLQAWLASIVEIGAGVLLWFGLLTPMAAAGLFSVMVVAWAINHRRNGFFIFRPGEGWEYVFTLAVAAVAVGTVGPGEWSFDEVVGFADDLHGVAGLLTVLVGGGVSALLLLAACWRPPASPPRT